jgi:ribosome-associated translation inhibitor RaiA
MNKLREKIKNLGYADTHGKLEQITDDFSVELLIWMRNVDVDSLGIDVDATKGIKEIATKLQQYFKENIYGK